MKLEDIFIHQKPIVGVVRLLPLKGYKRFPGVDRVVEVALEDIKKLEKAGFDGALVDNHTHPHIIKATKEMKNCFIEVMKLLTKKVKIPLGVQVLLNDPEASLLIAKKSGAKFIRTDFFVDKVKTEHGFMEINPGKLMKYKKKIKADDVALLADVQVKHATMLEKKSLEQSVKEAVSWGADGVIVTGSWTGVSPSVTKIKKVKKEAEKTSTPVLVGSGFDENNAQEILKVADGVLMASAVRMGSRINYFKAKALMEKVFLIKKEVKMISKDIEGPNLVDLEKIAQVEELKQFLQEQGVEEPEFMTSGHMNLSWQGKFQGKEVVCQFGPDLSTYQLPLDKIKGYGYFDPKKYEQAQLVCRAVVGAGVPCPPILKAGYIETLSRSWCIAEEAEGEDLDRVWEQLPNAVKLSLGHQIGRTIANIHSISPDAYGQNPALPQAWHQSWFKQVFANLLALGIYQLQELEEIKESTVPQFLAEHMPPLLTTIHGDILQKNIFVEKSSGGYEVSSIIDWETAGVGNPWADVILAAWWISDEYGGNEKVYQTILNGYNEAVSEKRLVLSLGKASEMRPYIDLWWYLNILWVRPLMGDFSQVERRKEMVTRILEEIR